MYYVTEKQKFAEKQLTWEEVLSGIMEFASEEPGKFNHGTVTKLYTQEELNEKFLNNHKVNIDKLIKILETFNKEWDCLHKADKNKLYYTFFIPKKSGGKRQIDAPNDSLKQALRNLKAIFEKIFGAMYHTSAYAYVPGRCTIDAVRKHQNMKSNWFLKTDFSGFFPSTTLDYTMKMLSMIFPFSEVIKREDGERELRKALSLGFLNGGLPQGTPLSPMLTNLINIPVDYKIFKELSKRYFVYTRYADDMMVSSVTNFRYQTVIDIINGVLKEFDAPYVIKPEKTKYGSRKGKNWCLGVMLNKDNEITIGHERKKIFKAMINNFILDEKSGKSWNRSNVQKLAGLLSYYRMVERDYFDYVIRHMEQKYNVDFFELLKKEYIACVTDVPFVDNETIDVEPDWFF